MRKILIPIFMITSVSFTLLCAAPHAEAQDREGPDRDRMEREMPDREMMGPDMMEREMPDQETMDRMMAERWIVEQGMMEGEMPGLDRSENMKMPDKQMKKGIQGRERPENTNMPNKQKEDRIRVEEYLAKENATGIPVSADREELLQKVLSRQSGGTMLIANERLVLLPIDEIVKAMNIKPGMNIADIGAGIGVFSFPFADAMNGTGMVYATDTYKPNIEYLEKTSKDKNYANITPVMIQDPYKDPFYKKHSFDIIFMCDILPFIWKAGGYLREMQPPLAPKTGRLFIVEPRRLSGIDEVELTNIEGFEMNMRQMGRDFPVFTRLSKNTQTLIMDEKKDAAPVAMRKELAVELNTMLADRRLFDDLVDYYDARMNPPDNNINMPSVVALLSILEYPDAQYVRMLTGELDDSGVFEKKESELSPEDKERLQKLNKLLLCSLLKIGSYAYWQEIPCKDLIFRSKKSIIAKARAAGFELVADHDTIPKYYFLEFKRSD